MQDMLPEITGDANNLPMSFQTLSDTAKKLEGIIKGNNRAAFLALMKKVISAEQYADLEENVNEKGLPKRIITDRINATIVHAAFRASGITLIEIHGTPHLPDGRKIIMDWVGDMDFNQGTGFVSQLDDEFKYGPLKGIYTCPNCGGDIKVHIKREPFLADVMTDFGGKITTTVRNCTGCNKAYDSIEGLVKKT